VSGVIPDALDYAGPAVQGWQVLHRIYGSPVPFWRGSWSLNGIPWGTSII